MTFRARILGAAASGGLPQWNCGCGNCALARRRDIPAQIQSSLAVSPDGTDWAILNASPRHPRPTRPHAGPAPHRPARHAAPRGAADQRRHRPYRGPADPAGDAAFTLFATASIHEVLRAIPVIGALNALVVTRVEVALERPFDLLPGLTATLIAVPVKVPLYMEDEVVETDLMGEQMVGVILDSHKTLTVFIPGCAHLSDGLRARLSGADTVFFDGTLWRNDKMIRAGLGSKTGARMGHRSMSGPEGSIAAFDGLDAGRKVFIHMNNTNSVLRPDSSERAEVEAAGWTIGQDGMEIQ